MRYRHLALLGFGFLLAAVRPAGAQNQRTVPAAVAFRFESWQPTSPAPLSGTAPVERLLEAPSNRKRQALIGGAIGAAVGVLACTTVSTLANDSAEGGLSFCPLDSYLLIGAGGFLAGAVIGWVI
jgi:hypothetical protein